MIDYVALAKEKALSDKAKRTAEIQKAKMESDAKSKKMDDIIKELKSHVKKWDGVKGFTYEDKGASHYRVCAILNRNGNPCLSFKVDWKCWVTKYSDDDRGSDMSEACIMVTLHEEIREERTIFPNHSVVYMPSEREFVYPHDVPGLVDACMKSVSEYLSKFM